MFYIHPRNKFPSVITKLKGYEQICSILCQSTYICTLKTSLHWLDNLPQTYAVISTVPKLFASLLQIIGTATLDSTSMKRCKNMPSYVRQAQYGTVLH
jgi:hypothetical protein